MKRIPEHIGIIPDGNRRWAKINGLKKEEGYVHGLEPGLKLIKIAQNYGKISRKNNLQMLYNGIRNRILL